jgi:hypothetical protein
MLEAQKERLTALSRREHDVPILRHPAAGCVSANMVGNTVGNGDYWSDRDLWRCARYI